MDERTGKNEGLGVEDEIGGNVDVNEVKDPLMYLQWEKFRLDSL